MGHIKDEGECKMTNVEISGLIGGILAIISGLIVIAWPRIIAYIIGIYFILVGIIAVIASLR